MKELKQLIENHGKIKIQGMLGIRPRWIAYLLKGEKTPGEPLEKLIKIVAVVLKEDNPNKALAKLIKILSV